MRAWGMLVCRLSLVDCFRAGVDYTTSPSTGFPWRGFSLAAEEEIDLSTITPKDRNVAIKKEDIVRLIEQSGKYR